MNFIKLRIAVVFAAFSLMSFDPGAAHAANAIDAFYGQYKGQTTTDGAAKREMALTISPAKKGGFEIDWSTKTFGSGSEKTKSYSISFVPSGRDNIYSSAMRRNVFGKLTPMDPLKGDPFVWGRIEGDALIVYSLLITDDGGYEMQEYVRTLTANGLNLSFSRIQDGKTLKQITGDFTRIK